MKLSQRNKTTVTTATFASCVSIILFWILGVYAPELMAQAPSGAESAVTGIIVAVIGFIKNA